MNINTGQITSKAAQLTSVAKEQSLKPEANVAARSCLVRLPARMVVEQPKDERFNQGGSC